MAEPGMPQWKTKALRERNLQLINEHLVCSAKTDKNVNLKRFGAILNLHITFGVTSCKFFSKYLSLFGKIHHKVDNL